MTHELPHLQSDSWARLDTSISIGARPSARSLMPPEAWGPEVLRSELGGLWLAVTEVGSFTHPA
jgi:hypothetical protein